MSPHVTLGPVLAALLLAAGCTTIPSSSTSDDTPPGDTYRPARASLRSDAADTPNGVVRTTLAVPTGDRSTSAILVEKLAPREARLNRPYDYRIRVTNLTDTPLVNVVVHERAPDLFTVSKSEPAARNEGGWANYPVGELAPRASRTIDVSGVAKAEGKLNTCIAVDYQPTLCVAADVVNPILKLTKEGPADAELCEGIRYRYVVSNVGTGTEHDVTVEDVLPEGVVTEDGKKTVSIRVGDLEQGASKELLVRVKPAKTGQYASAAIVRAPGGVEVRSQEVSTTVRQPNLDVTVTGPDTEYLNKTATYVVTVKNTGDAPAKRTVLGIDTAEHGQVADVLIGGGPKGGEPRAAAAYRQGGTDLDTIAPGESRTVTVTVRATKEGRLPITTTAAAACVPPVTGKIATEIKTLPALRLEVVDVEDPIRVGDDVTYRVTVKNQGTGADKNVAITATLPPELQFVTSAGPTDSTADGQTLRFATLDTLAPGEQAVWRIQAKATKTGDVRMRVQLKSDSMTEPAGESEPTRLY